MPLANAISVDVEDYFQTEAMSAVAPRTHWDSFPTHVEANTFALFELFARYRVHATFFFMGWVAERFPQLVAPPGVSDVIGRVQGGHLPGQKCDSGCDWSTCKGLQGTEFFHQLVGV